MTIFFPCLLTLFCSLSPDTSKFDLRDPVPPLIEALNQGNEVQQSLACQDLYENSHFSTMTLDALAALEKKLDSIEHQELRGEAALVLQEFYRQVGDMDAIKKLIPELGFCAGWQVLGPLMADTQVDWKAYRRKVGYQTQGANRAVQEYYIPSYGEKDYLGEGAGHFGFFNANLALFPSQLESAYYRCWFYSPSKEPLRLGVGWSNQMKIWVNDVQIADLKGDQIPHNDQKVIFFSVKKGWHQLTLRCESDDQDSILGFFCRLTDLSGNPITTSGTGKRKSKKVPVILDSAKYEKSLTSMATEMGPEWLAFIMLQKEIKKDDVSPKDLLAQSVSKTPDRRSVEKLLLLESDPNKKWEYLDLFLKTYPGDPWGLAQKGTIALSQSRYWEARHYAQEALDGYPGYWKGKLLENNVLSQMGLFGETLKRTEELRKQFGDIPWILMDLCDLYDQIGLEKQMVSVLKEIFKIRHNSKKFNQMRIDYLTEKEKTTDLARFYETLVKEKPDNVSLFLQYTDFLVANGHPDKAETLLKQKVQTFPENPYLLESLGKVQLELKRPVALRTLQHILNIDPQNPQIEKTIRMYQATEQSFYSPYELEPGMTSMQPKDGVVIDLKNTVKKVASSGQSSVFQQIAYRIVDEQGPKVLRGYAFSYAPLRQHAEILKAEIHRQDQTIILSQFNRTRISDPAYRTYYDLVSYQIPFPPLQTGDRVFLEYRIDDIADNIFGNYYGSIEYFVEAYPVGLKSYTLILPDNLPFHYTTNNMDPVHSSTKRDNFIIQQWKLESIPIMESEPLMPPQETNIAYLSYSSFASWDELAQWYHDLIAGQLELDHETRELVKTLCEGAENDKEKVARIHEFVIKHTRYVALEFGIHGYKPYEVNRVCSRQFGDCKDKASLMVAMLREAGIEASIAIVRTADRGFLSTDPPNLGCFNHAITYVPQFDLFLDGTAEYSGMDELPEMDQGAQVFIVDEHGNGRLTRIPVQPAANNSRARGLIADIINADEVLLSGKLSFSGIHAPSMRRLLEGKSPSNELVQQVLSNLYPGIQISDETVKSGPLDQPIAIDFKGTTANLIQGDSGFSLSLLGSPLLPVLAPTAGRKFPIWLGVPETNSTDLELTSEMFSFSELPEDLNIDNPWLNIEIRFTSTASNHLKIHYQVIFKQNLIPVDQYDMVRSALDQHDKYLLNFIQLVPIEGANR